MSCPKPYSRRCRFHELKKTGPISENRTFSRSPRRLRSRAGNPYPEDQRLRSSRAGRALFGLRAERDRIRLGHADRARSGGRRHSVSNRRGRLPCVSEPERLGSSRGDVVSPVLAARGARKRPSDRGSFGADACEESPGRRSPDRALVPRTGVAEVGRGRRMALARPPLLFTHQAIPPTLGGGGSLSGRTSRRTRDRGRAPCRESCAESRDRSGSPHRVASCVRPRA